jgi:GntR family transcriptional regulator
MDSPTSWKEEISIDHGSLRPLYMQVREALEEWITNGLHDGSLCPGDRLPSENELCEKLKVSPITVKRALDDLRRQGLIQRIQGRGSFIAGQHKITLPLTKFFSLTNLALQKGMTPARHTLSIAEQAASPRLANRLNISEEESVIKLVRVRLMDDKPFAVETTYLPSPLFPDFLALFTDQIPSMTFWQNAISTRCQAGICLNRPDPLLRSPVIRNPCRLTGVSHTAIGV